MDFIVEEMCVIECEIYTAAVGNAQAKVKIEFKNKHQDLLSFSCSK